MNINLLKSLIFAFFLGFSVLFASTRSFAQADSSMGGDDSSSEEQAREAHTQETLNQIHDLERKMEENAKRLDALETAVNQSVATAQAVDANTTVQEAPAQVASEPTASAQVNPVEAAVPSEQKAIAEIKAEPIDVLPQPSAYFTPMLSILKENTFELSEESFYSAFKVSGSNQNYKRHGGFYGLNGAYTFRPMEAENWFINVFHADVHGDFGMENYNFTGDGKIKNASNSIVEPRVWVGKDLNLNPSLLLTPYVGFGYRLYYEQLKNKFSDAQDDDGGNNVETQYFYVPIGGQVSFKPVEGWRIDLNSEYDILAWARVTNESADFTLDSNTIKSPAYTNSFRHGYGIQESVKFVKEGEHVNYFVEPYLRYWSIKASNTVSATGYVNGNPVSFTNQQDKNHTAEIGARLGVEF